MTMQGAQDRGSRISWDNFLVRFSEGSGDANLTMLPPPATDLAQRGLFLKPSLPVSSTALAAAPADGLDGDILDYEASVEPLLTDTPPPPVRDELERLTS